jgi:hypothetical protein
MLLRMRKVLENSCRENQNTRFIFSNFYSENRAVYEIKCRKTQNALLRFTASVVKQTRRRYRLHVYCLSCILARDGGSQQLTVGCDIVQLDRRLRSSAVLIPVHETARCLVQE